MTSPDGGWGWMVVFAYFCISVITDGIRYSFGIMFISLLEAFGRGSGETAWVGGLLAGTTNIVGPLVTKLADRFGCRAVAIAGSLIASLGLFTSVFAQELYHLYITLGVMTGFGYGMIFLTSIVSVSRYFDKKRALAMGISVCGSGIGSVIFNPLSKWLLDEYGWRGTLLIEAGLVLNCVAFGALYRPLPKILSKANDEEIKESDILLKSNPNKNEPEGDTHVKSLKNSESAYSCDPKRNSSDYTSGSNGFLNYELNVTCHENKGAAAKHEPNGVVSEISSFLPYSQEGVTSLGARDEGNKYERSSKLKQCMKFTRELFRFSLLKDPSFLVFFTSGFLISLSYNVPYIYLPDLATRLDYTKSMGVLLISYLGIANTISRVLFGILGDRPGVSRTYVYIATNMISGIFTVFVPLYSQYGLLVMYAVVYGMTIGGYVSLSTLVAGDLFSLEVITESIGLFMLACGIATFIGAPLAGWLYDITKSYDVSFISTGVALVLAGAILFIIPCIRHGKHKS